MPRVFAVLGGALVLFGLIALSGPAFGFTTFAGDRAVSVGVAEDSSALLGIEATGETPDMQNDVVVINITNNANEDYDTLDTAVTIDDPKGALEISNGFAGSLDRGQTTGLELTCDSGGNGEATVTVDADAFGSTLRIESVSFSTTFQYSCTGSGNEGGNGGGNTDPGTGFSSVNVSNVVENTGPGQQVQTVTFTPSSDLKNKENVVIDLSEANPDPIDYTSVGTGDVVVESGNGRIDSVEDGVITYESGQGNTKDQAGNEIELTVTNFETFDSGGPFEATFDRANADSTEAGKFYVTENT